MLFSMLANLAEDRQGIAAEPGADVSAALKRLKSHDICVDQVMKLLDKALIVPVLTAHPTEVRRKSMIDHRNRIAELMQMKDAGITESEAEIGRAPCRGRSVSGRVDLGGRRSMKQNKENTQTNNKKYTNDKKKY